MSRKGGYNIIDFGGIFLPSNKPINGIFKQFEKFYTSKNKKNILLSGISNIDNDVFCTISQSYDEKVFFFVDTTYFSFKVYEDDIVKEYKLENKIYRNDIYLDVLVTDEDTKKPISFILYSTKPIDADYVYQYIEDKLLRKEFATNVLCFNVNNDNFLSQLKFINNFYSVPNYSIIYLYTTFNVDNVSDSRSYSSGVFNSFDEIKNRITIDDIVSTTI